tara:strand:- start:188 stop:1744 length:1557 start_codon:yes stop_codon:yes gene_type:complete
MAKTITYNVVSDTTQAVKSQENLTDSIEDTGEAMKETKKETADYGGIIDKLTGGMASSFKGAIKGVKGLGKGFKGLRGAVIATGIGALVVLVTAAVEWFSNFDAAIRLASQAMDAIGGAVNQLGKSFDLLLKGDFSGAADAFTDVGNAALQAAKNAGELYDINIKLQELQAKNIPLNAQLRQDLELQKKILEDTTLTEKERLAALENVTALSAQIQQNAIDENVLKQKSLELSIANENNDQKRRELNIELAQTQAELITQEGGLLLIKKDAEKVEREILSITRQKRIDQLAEELRIKKELNAIDKIELEGFDSVIDATNKNNNEILMSNRKLAGGLKEIKDEDLKYTRFTEEEKKQAVIGSIDAIDQITGSLSTIFEGNAKAQKSISIAQALIDTYKGANAAYTSLAGVPIVGIPLGIAAAAAATAAGLANVKRIKNTKISKATPPSASGARGGSFSGKPSGGGANNFFPTQIGAIPQNTSNVNVQNLNNTPPRAYIVASDISDSTRAQEILKQKSTM